MCWTFLLSRKLLHFLQLLLFKAMICHIFLGPSLMINICKPLLYFNFNITRMLFSIVFHGVLLFMSVCCWMVLIILLLSLANTGLSFPNLSSICFLPFNIWVHIICSFYFQRTYLLFYCQVISLEDTLIIQGSRSFRLRLT